MKYKAKTKECRLIVLAKTSTGERIDERALDAFSRLYPRGFLKPKLIKKNQIEYTGPVGISLFERLRKPVTKRDFLFIMEQIVVAAQKIQKNGLLLAKLVLDIHYIYINEHTKEMQFLYVPTMGETANGGIKALMETVIYSSVPVAEKDTDYISRFAYFLKSQRGFDLSAIENHIAKEDKSIVATIRKQNAGQSGFMTSKQRDYYDHHDQIQDGQDDATGLLDNDEATGLLEDDATGLLDDEQTGLLTDSFEEGTALLDENTVVQPISTPPNLVRKQTGETISLNRPVFRLGKEGGPADYAVANNKYISRNHADIITRGDRYYVVDLNSMNHTYVNGQMLPAQCETELHDGDCLLLGNEEFTFQLERKQRKCSACGADALPGANFCNCCGHRL